MCSNLISLWMRFILPSARDLEVNGSESRLHYIAAMSLNRDLTDAEFSAKVLVRQSANNRKSAANAARALSGS
jgi:hypothetical protein